jgi:hypothetical protein
VPAAARYSVRAFETEGRHPVTTRDDTKTVRPPASSTADLLEEWRAAERATTSAVGAAEAARRAAAAADRAAAAAERTAEAAGETVEAALRTAEEAKNASSELRSAASLARQESGLRDSAVTSAGDQEDEARGAFHRAEDTARARHGSEETKG